MRKIFIIAIILLSAAPHGSMAQDEKKTFTRQDSLRGSITPERAWWDAVKYDITVQPDYDAKTIEGKNIMTYKALSDGSKMQIDLQEPMTLTHVTHNKTPLQFTRDGNVYYISFDTPVKKGETMTLDFGFSGKPREAMSPPWDGGWIWKKDAAGNPWMSVACEGLGASAWYPCKDHLSDEPDSAALNIVAANGLVAVGNGRLLKKTDHGNGTTTWSWGVVNPINNYNIIPYIGKYVHWSEKYLGEKGQLDLDYWVLEEDLAKAKKQFLQVPKMLRCFEHWFGPYPFYEDGYKLVQAPHLGMEHQSAVAYGNKFQNGYNGTDLSGTGWGTKWDFIIIHESGHEWFGNNISMKDAADMWIHEAFTNYSETLFTQCEFGKKAGNEYLRGLRPKIENKSPITGTYGVNNEGPLDMYYKGSNFIHTIRQVFNDDEKFRKMLRGLNKDFYHQTVTAQQIEAYVSKSAGRDLSAVFKQYLSTTQIPVLQYRFEKGSLRYKWSNCVRGFNMPVKIKAAKEIWLEPGDEWKTISLNSTTLVVDPNFYVDSRKM